jgi:hypothetical protein
VNEDVERGLALMAAGVDPELICQLIDPEGEIPDMTPEQAARVDRKLRAAIAAQDRRRALRRRLTWVVSGSLAAACCVAALVFAARAVRPRLTVSLESQAVVMHDLDSPGEPSTTEVSRAAAPLMPPREAATGVATSAQAPR